MSVCAIDREKSCNNSKTKEKCKQWERKRRRRRIDKSVKQHVNGILMLRLAALLFRWIDREHCNDSLVQVSAMSTTLFTHRFMEIRFERKSMLNQFATIRIKAFVLLSETEIDRRTVSIKERKMENGKMRLYLLDVMWYIHTYACTSIDCQCKINTIQTRIKCLDSWKWREKCTLRALGLD